VPDNKSASGAVIAVTAVGLGTALWRGVGHEAGEAVTEAFERSSAEISDAMIGAVPDASIAMEPEAALGASAAAGVPFRYRPYDELDDALKRRLGLHSGGGAQPNSSLPPSDVPPLVQPLRIIPLVYNFGSKEREEWAVQEVVGRAQPHITQDLEPYRYTLTYTQVQPIIYHDLVESAKNISAKRDSTIKFEALTGKLTIDASYKTGSFQLEVGEVNLYKVSAVAAAGVVACKMSATAFPDCVDKVLTKVGKAAVDLGGEGGEQKTSTPSAEQASNPVLGRGGSIEPWGGFSGINWNDLRR
jgi:hypothetical protein